MFFKKILLMSAVIGLLLSPIAVLADSGDNALQGLQTAAGSSGADLPTKVAGASNVVELIGAIVGIALSLIGAIFFVLVLYAGGVWMTAMGNSERVTKAKELLETASIGLVIVLAAYAIANFVFSNLVGGGGSGLDESKCTAVGGVCGAPSLCRGTVTDGLCPGGADYKCCKP